LRRGEDGARPDPLVELAGVYVEEGGDPQAVAGKTGVGSQGHAHAASAHHDGFLLANQTQELGQVVSQRFDGVSHPRPTELPQVGEVLPSLRCRHVRGVAQLL